MIFCTQLAGFHVPSAASIRVRVFAGVARLKALDSKPVIDFPRMHESGWRYYESFQMITRLF